MCLILCGTHCPLLFLLIFAYFSSLKTCVKNTLTSLVSFCSDYKNEPVFVSQNQQSGRFMKFNKHNSNILPQVVQSAI